MQIGDVAGNQLTLGVVPWSGTDAIARIQTRRSAPLFLAKVGVPCVIEVEPARGLSGVLTNLVGAGDSAEIASARRVLGNEEGHCRGLLLLALRQLGGGAYSCDSNGGKKDLSVHCDVSIVTVAILS